MMLLCVCPTSQVGCWVLHSICIVYLQLATDRQYANTTIYGCQAAASSTLPSLMRPSGACISSIPPLV